MSLIRLSLDCLRISTFLCKKLVQMSHQTYHKACSLSFQLVLFHNIAVRLKQDTSDDPNCEYKLKRNSRNKIHFLSAIVLQNLFQCELKECPALSCMILQCSLGFSWNSRLSTHYRMQGILRQL